MKPVMQKNQIIVSAERLRKLRRWRMLSGLGGLALASSFFMPALEGCRRPVIPMLHAWEELNEQSLDIEDVLGVFICFTSAYLFGLLCLLVALRGLRYDWEKERSAGKSIGLLSAATILSVTVGYSIAFTKGYTVTSWPDWPAWAFTLFLMIYYLVSLRRGAAGRFCLRWYGAFCCIVWFGLFLIWWLIERNKIYYGLWTSLAGSLCIFLAAHGEACTRAALGWWAALGKLTRCRLELSDLDGPRCRKCGYLLIGLTSHRCPECGLGFDPAEHGMSGPTREVAAK